MHARARGAALEAAAGHLVGLLAAAGIRALELKGASLAREAHGDVGLRESADIDLLVDADELPRAARVLRDRGYEAPRDPVRPDGMPDRNYSLPHPELPPVELHWRIHWYDRGFSSRLLERARPGASGELAANPVDQAAALLLFFARDGLQDLRLAVDIAAWWDRHGAQLPEAALDGVAARHPELRRALGASAAVAERVAGVPAAAWLSGHVPGDRRAALAGRVADWSQTIDRDQISANTSLVDALLAPPGGLREFTRRQLLTVRRGSRAAHAAKTSARFVLAAIRAARGGWKPLPDVPDERPAAARPSIESRASDRDARSQPPAH